MDKPVAGEELAALAEKYEKDIVVVLAYNVKLNVLTVTTHGSPSQQNKAAQWGERCAVLLGGDLRGATWHDDYRPSGASMADLQAQLEFMRERMRAFKEHSDRDVSEAALRCLADVRTIKRHA